MEQLTRAQQSRNLGEAIEGHGDVDWLRASGMVAQRHAVALAVWRLVELRDARSLQESFVGLTALGMRMGLDEPPRVALDVLRWIADPVCRHCYGRGYEAVMGTPHLSAIQCGACGGSGLRPNGWDDDAAGLAERLKDVQRQAAAAIMRKLS